MHPLRKVVDFDGVVKVGVLENGGHLGSGQLFKLESVEIFDWKTIYVQTWQHLQYQLVPRL